ncbi:facilitated trehalose transporter Tret1-like isoform X2 [Phymastichus coffea]|uniref:facilitated trehalose transporter Tret1-like isoform X2 n=1 Tax=Phymastichus coffea TaxID=108790 RepID=UPI00273B4592|nr:facilitated trehalose transporter Tret1-like isoform X2 [Phymastichus coffea]
MFDVPLNGQLRQFLAAIIVNLMTISFGISCGWPSSIIPQLRSNSSPIGKVPMSEQQISWIGGLLPIGGLLMIPLCGILTERLGLRNFAFLTGLPHIVSWLLIIFAQNYFYIYAARLIIGMAGAMTFFIVPILLSLSANTGVLFAFVAGTFLSYRLFASLCLIFPIVCIATILFIPETPVYLVKQSRQLEAHKSLMFFHDNNRSLVEEELARLQQQVNASNRTSKSFSVGEFFSDRATRKGLIISIGLIAGQQFSGIFAMLSYAETIFQRAGSSVSSQTAPIIIGTIQIFGAYMSTMLMDRVGRRLLTLISCSGTTISHALVATFFYLQKNNYDVNSISWLPVVALSTYIIAYALGMASVPLIIVSEVFRLSVNSYATTLCLILFWAMSFTSIKIFDLTMDFFDADGCFFMLACCCLTAFIFTCCMMPETKGRKREDIVNELAGVDKARCKKDKKHVEEQVR